MSVKDLSARKRSVVGLSLLFLCLGLGLGSRLLLVPVSGRSQWLGFRVLLVDSRISEAEVLEGLGSAGVKEVISESTEPVIVCGWSGLETMSLAEARSRILPDDPRMDGYLRRIGLWFEARTEDTAYRVYYLKVASPFIAGTGIDREIERGLAAWKGRFLLPDAGPSDSASDSVFFVFFSVFLLVLGCIVGPLIDAKAFQGHRPRVLRKFNGQAFKRIALRLGIALPWFVFASGGLKASAVATVWGLALVELADRLDLPLEEFNRGASARSGLKALSLQAPPALALALTALIMTLAFPVFLPSIGLASLGSIVVTSGQAILGLNRAGRRHFVPLIIAGRARLRSGSAAGNLRALLLCLDLALWGVLVLLPDSGQRTLADALSLPQPLPISGSLRPLPDEAGRMALAEGPDSLPGLGAYLEHRAEEEALPYLRIGDSSKEPFVRSLLPLPPGTEVSKNQTGQGPIFSDDWARAAYNSVPPLSVEGMLLRQGRAMAGSLGPLGGNGRPLAPIEYLLYILLLVTPVGRLLRRFPSRRVGVPGELRQEA